MISRRALVRLAGALALLALVACGSQAKQLQGRWETVDTPKRTLDLFQDGTFSMRLSGKTLGFLSAVLGPRHGTWRVEGGSLVLITKGDDGVVSEEKLPINELGPEQMVLGQERWNRVAS